MDPSRARRAFLILLALVVAACSQANNPAAKPSPAHPTVITGSIGRAAYRIEVPVGWNGTLFLYSHGYVAPGGSNPAVAAPGAEASSWLLGHHLAIAGSSYSSTGWALEDAFKDQIALLDLFDQRVATPTRVIAWGHSLGGIITAGLVQLDPDRFAGAIPMCGVLSGGVASWNTGLDSAYAFRTLLASRSTLKVTDITDPAANLQVALDAFNQAKATPAGEARLALVAALAGLPGWFDPTRPEPVPNDFQARVAAQESWEARVDFPFEFKYRAELEQRAGGNPSWNTGVDYHHQLSTSPDAAEVKALYRAAELDLESDIRALDAGPRIKADPAAVAYLDRNLSLDGGLSVPVLTMHTTGDGLVIPQNETAYAGVVKAAGKQDLLREVFVHRAGHCAFTPAETIALVQAMIDRLDTGHWDDQGLRPAALNASALAQGQSYNSFFGFALASAFIDFKPGPYPRPFANGSIAP
ncbi:MAG: S9 family peptidase [Candidatus Dormibacteraeota bacterium]|nr:S9 family peptidase [Candidatus Dormibacteraeota bacterium]